MEPSQTKQSNKKSKLIIIGVLVLAAIAGAWFLLNKDKNSTTTSSGSSNSAASSKAEADCKKLYDDKDICKFTGGWTSDAAYKASFVTTSKDGKTTTMTMEQDGKNNVSMTTKEGDKEVSAFISLNGDTYIKDSASNSWIKYPKSPGSSTTTPTDNLKFDLDENTPVEQRLSFKKIGKEKCGNATCFKYQIVDPAQSGDETTVWFGDKDYVLRKWSVKDTDGSTNVGEFSFGAVSIKAPSPVTEMPSTTNTTNTQDIIDQAQDLADQ